MARRSRVEDHVEPVFEFCVEGTARTARGYQNGGPLRTWKTKVAAQALKTLAASAMIEGAVELRITEFSDFRTKDRDNFVKPIQDALQGILFQNDRQVLRLESDWRDINGLFRVRYMSEVVAAALVVGREFVWVRVYRHRSQKKLTS